MPEGDGCADLCAGAHAGRRGEYLRADGLVSHLGLCAARLLPDCGTSLFAKRADGVTISLMMGSLDVPDRFAPTRQIWMSSKQAWVDLGGELQCYQEGPPPA